MDRLVGALIVSKLFGSKVAKKVPFDSADSVGWQYRLTLMLHDEKYEWQRTNDFMYFIAETLE